MNEQCKALVTARCGGRCERCGGIGRSFHHRKKVSQGGEWCPSNIVRLCGSGTTGCHGWVEHEPNAAEAEGWHVRPWGCPEEIPVKYGRKEWLQLLPDGEVVESEPVASGDDGDSDQDSASEQAE